MKLSHFTVGVLLMASAAGKAQSVNAIKSDTLGGRLSSDTKMNSASKDTIILNPVKKSPDHKYCCGKCGKG